MGANYAKGTTLGYGALVDGALPNSFTTIGNVFSISGPQVSVETLDCTNLSSTAKEYLAVPLPDNGELTFSYYVDKDVAAQGTLRDSVSSGTVYGFKLTFTSDASNAKFKAFVKGYNYSGLEPNGLIQCEMTVQITEAITWGSES